MESIITRNFTCKRPTCQVKEVVLLIKMAGGDVSCLADQQEVGGELAPVVPLLPLVQPLPVEVHIVMFDLLPHSVCENRKLTNHSNLRRSSCIRL